jgi:hypothetical protein
MSLLLFLLFKQFEIFAIPGALEFIERNKPQRRRVYAIAQSTGVFGTIVEDMAKMTVTVARSDFGSTHAMSAISAFLYVVRFNRLGEARPTAVAVELVEGRKQWLTRYDVHIDSRLIMIPIRILERTFGSVLLGDLELFKREARDGFRALRII